MKRQTEVGWVFLCTVLVYLGASQVLSCFTLPSAIRIVIGQLILILPSVIYLIMKKEKVTELLRIRKISIANVILLILFAFLILPILAVCNAFSMLFTRNEISVQVEGIVTNVPLFAALILIALIPCILEESVYRGMFYNEFRKIRPLAAVVLSGLLFGLMHMNFNQFAYAFVLGCILPLVIEATDSILASMVIHFTINANSTIWMYLLPKVMQWAEDMMQSAAKESGVSVQDIMGDAAQGGSVSEIANAVGNDKMALLASMRLYAVIGVVTGVLAFLVYKAIAKNAGRWEILCEKFGRSSGGESEGNVQTGEAKERLLSLPLVIGIVLCLAMMVYRAIAV